MARIFCWKKIADMIDPRTAVPLEFPVQFAPEPACLVYLNIKHTDAIKTLGQPLLTDWVDGLGDTDFWAYKFACGLQIVIQFRHIREGGGIVCADSPEINHVIRHLPFSTNECKSIGDAQLRKDIDLLLTASPERQAEIDALFSYQVWRQGDDGNPFKIGEPTSERDCKCIVNHYESLHHKQTYWYSHI